MGSPSKEEQIKELILENSPFKHWHFEEIVKQTKITRAAVNKWLKKYQKEKLIKKIKEKGKFPYFICGQDNPTYKSEKKLYILKKIYKSGLITYILSSKEIKTAIIFGSIAKGDWYKDSDIDIFIYGKAKKLNKPKYEIKLKRNIELHMFKSKKEIKKVKTGLIKNIINGYIIKGNLQDFIDIK